MADRSQKLGVRPTETSQVFGVRPIVTCVHEPNGRLTTRVSNEGGTDVRDGASGDPPVQPPGEGWTPNHVDQFVGTSPKMALEVHGKPTEDSLNGMAEAL